MLQKENNGFEMLKTVVSIVSVRIFD